MKKVCMYGIGFCGVVLLFSLSFFMSYKSALEDFNNEAVKENVKEQIKEPVVLEADASNIIKVTPETLYILEIYDIKTEKITQTTLPTPDYLIGLKREEVIDYLMSYMKEVPLDDYQKGLVSYELISYNKDNIVLRKSYNQDLVPYMYYMMLLKGTVVIYYSDKKTVYEYTEINVSTLPEEEQVKLYKGIGIKDQEELYSLLENYSS